MLARHRAMTLLIACGFLSGCASSPALTPDQTGRVVATTPSQVMRSYETAGSNSVVVDAPPEKVLDAVRSVLTDLGIEVKLYDPPHGQIGNRNFSRTYRLQGQPLSRYLGCGMTLMGEAADSYRVTMELLSQVTPEIRGSRLQTWLTAAAQDIGASGDRVSCLSKGVLEAQVNQLAAERVGR